MTKNKMRAVTLLGENHLEMREIPIPTPAKGEILVRVRAATTCGTDLKTYRRGHPKFPPPFVFGHEFGGDIVAIGEGVDKFSLGMRVTANVFGECEKCYFCLLGQGNLCENLEYNFGAFAEYNLIPASIVRRNTFVIPEHISYSQAAIVEPLVSVVHAAKLVDIKKGERVAIIGAGGPISLLFIQMAVLAKASEIIAIGHSDHRLKIAKQLGATQLINAKRLNSLEIINERTNNMGVDVVIECAGTKKAWETAINITRRGGRVLWFGGLPSGTIVNVDAAKVHYGEINLLNSHGGTAEDAKFAFDLISNKRIDTQSLITHELNLNQVERAMELMIAGEAIKVAIQP